LYLTGNTGYRYIVCIVIQIGTPVDGCQERYKAMSDTPAPRTDPGEPLVYEIRIDGHLEQTWTDWLEGSSIQLEEDGKTLLTCRVIDQPALYGLLKRVRDLGMPLLSVRRLEPGRAETLEVKPSGPSE